MRAYWILKKASTICEEVCTNVNDEKANIIKEHTKVLQNNKSDGSDSEVETEYKEEAAMNDKGLRLIAFEELIDGAEAKLQSIYVQDPEPTNLSVSLVKKAYEDIKLAEQQ